MVDIDQIDTVTMMYIISYEWLDVCLQWRASRDVLFDDQLTNLLKLFYFIGYW